MEKTIKNAENANRFTSIPFRPLTMIKKGGKARRFVILWLVSCALIIPSSVITRFLELTGLEITVGGVSIFFTLYIPMLVCIPMVFWFGYFWAAIPAYLSTFTVAYFGGMPTSWILLFSFANPLSLAFYYLSISITPMDLRSNLFVSLIGFVLISLVASLAGSTGSFIWAFANQVGLNNALPIWQGWWVGGWLQATILVLPMLYFLGPRVANLSHSLKLQTAVNASNSYKVLALVTITFVMVLIGYVMTARFIGIRQLEALKEVMPGEGNLLNINNAISGMSYPLFILLAVMVALIFLAYRAIVYWSGALQNANELLVEKNAELEKLATIDTLTQLLVRRKVMEVAAAEFDRALRHSLGLSIMMIDIDKFKRINDEHGHLVGDQVIFGVAERIKQSVRPYDSAGRYGGEEFIVILPETEVKEANCIAQRILANVASTPIKSEGCELSVTVSIGVASLSWEEMKLNGLIERADQALLSAKREGRNRVKEAFSMPELNQ